MDVISKIDGCRVFRQVYHITLWRKGKNTTLKEINFQVFKVGHINQNILLNLRELFGPLDFFCRKFNAAVIIMPMRGNAKFRFVMHFFGANLELYRFSVQTKNGGMKRFISIGFWLGRIVFDPAFEWFPYFMNHTESRVTIRNIGNYDSKRDDVVNFIRFPIFLGQFLVETV